MTTAPIKIYGTWMSQPFRAVAWACMIKKVPHEIIPIVPGKKTSGGSRSPDFLEINPLGFIPVIDDSGFILWESHAILLYLATKFHWDDFYPEDIKIRAKINEYFNWHHRNIREVTIKLLAPYVRPDLFLTTNPKDLGVVKGIIGKLEIVYLTPGPFLVGQGPTLADLACYEELVQCLPEFCDFVDFGEFPKVTKWMAAMRLLPKHQEAHVFLGKISEIVKAAKKAKM